MELVKRLEPEKDKRPLIAHIKIYRFAYRIYW